MSVLRLNPGETILQKGEAATFCGFLLQGICHVIINKERSISVELGRGAILGKEHNG
jgi:CRP-like cAMP-binding protein